MESATGIVELRCVSRVTLRFMHSKVTGGVVIEPIPIRVGGVKISTDDRRGERCGGHVCKIAKWKRGYAAK